MLGLYWVILGYRAWVLRFPRGSTCSVCSGGLSRAWWQDLRRDLELLGDGGHFTCSVLQDSARFLLQRFKRLLHTPWPFLR